MGGADAIINSCSEGARQFAINPTDSSLFQCLPSRLRKVLALQPHSETFGMGFPRHSLRAEGGWNGVRREGGGWIGIAS